MISKKRREKNRGLYIFFTVLIFLIIVYLLINLKDAWSKYREAKSRTETATQTYESLKVQYEEIQKEKEFEQSTTGQEAQIRTKFDLVKPEEQAVMIIHEEVPEVVEEETGMKKFFNTFKNFFN